jgi:hypothetical protein
VGKHPEHVSGPQCQAGPENILTPRYAVLCRCKLSRFCVALREKSAVHGPECLILPAQKGLPECVSILCHLDSRD